jgi:hypothetical protein
MHRVKSKHSKSFYHGLVLCYSLVYVVVNRCKYYGHKHYSPLFKKICRKRWEKKMSRNNGLETEWERWPGKLSGNDGQEI